MRRGNTILCHTAIAHYLLFGSMIGVEKQQPLKTGYHRRVYSSIQLLLTHRYQHLLEGL